MTRHHSSHTGRVGRADSSPKRLRDWAAEDRAQVGRGRLDIYVHKSAFRRPRRTGRRGRPATFSQQLYQAAAVIRQLDMRSWRCLEGFLIAVSQWVCPGARTPDHVSLWRAAERVRLPEIRLPGGPRVIVIDSTGVKITGPGEWRAKRDETRRQYVKLHIARDLHTGRILDWELTPPEGEGTGDPSVGSLLLRRLARRGLTIDRVLADGAYDRQRFRQAVWDAGGRAVIPPRRDAKPSFRARPPDWQAERDQQVLACWRSDHDRADWKHASGYHERSLVETTFSRYQALFGPSLTARLPDRQHQEITIAIHLLNQHARRSLA